MAKIDINRFQEIRSSFLEDLELRRDKCFLCKWIITGEDPTGVFKNASRLMHLDVEFPEKFESLLPGLHDRLQHALARTAL